MLVTDDLKVRKCLSVRRVRSSQLAAQTAHDALSCKRLLGEAKPGLETSPNKPPTHLPELGTDLVAALASLNVNNLTHVCLCFREFGSTLKLAVLLAGTFLERGL
jgi:hypothetical protein